MIIKLKIIFLFSVSLFFGCKSKEIKQTESGFWILENQTGGIAGRNITEADRGYSVKLILCNNGKFYQLKNDSISEQGTYSIGNGKSIYQKEAQRIISLSSGKKLVVMKINATEMELAENYYDGFGFSYLRTKSFKIKKIPFQKGKNP